MRELCSRKLAYITIRPKLRHLLRSECLLKFERIPRRERTKGSHDDTWTQQNSSGDMWNVDLVRFRLLCLVLIIPYHETRSHVPISDKCVRDFEIFIIKRTFVYRTEASPKIQLSVHIGSIAMLWFLPFLKIEEEFVGIADFLGNGLQECNTLSSINETMIVR